MELLPFQKEGVRFLLTPNPATNNKPHFLLADEMGLGKTIQAIVAAKRAGVRSSLIICPANVKYNWQREMVAWGWAEDKDIFIVRTRIDEIPKRGMTIRDNTLHVIVNYELLISPEIWEQLMAREWKLAIMDEAHKLKNFDSKRTVKVLGKRGKGILHRCYMKWALTGTFVPNRAMETFPLLKTMAPEVIAPFNSQVEFGRYFCNGFKNGFGGWNFKGASHIEELRERLKPFMLRREVDEVYRELPPVIPSVVYFEVDLFEHPEVRENKIEFPEGELPLATLRRIVAELKMVDAAEYIQDLLLQVDKVVVFAYHKNVIKELSNMLEEFNPVTIGGGLNSEQKQNLVDKFQSDPRCRVAICQPLAIGEGTNGLQKVCNYVVFAELDWCPATIDQAMARLRRIGQTKPVFAYFLIAAGTVEETMATVVERKRSIINELIKGDPSMSLEQAINRLCDILEKNQGVVTTSEPADKPAASKKDTPKTDKKETEKKVKLDDVKAAAAAFCNANDNVAENKKQAREIIKSFGVEKLDDIPEKKWAEAIKKFEAGPSEESDSTDDL